MGVTFQFAFRLPRALFDLDIVLWTCEYFKFTGCRLTDLSEIFNRDVDGERNPSVFGVLILEDCVFCGKLKFFGSTKAPELTERCVDGSESFDPPLLLLLLLFITREVVDLLLLRTGPESLLPGVPGLRREDVGVPGKAPIDLRVSFDARFNPV